MPARRLRRVRRIVVAASCLGLLITPLQVDAAAPNRVAARRQATPSQVVADVALADGGALFGQVVDRQGSPAVGTEVKLVRGRRTVATAGTDAQGRFVIRSLPGGVYRVAAAGGVSLIRAWSPQTAPPSAKPGILMVLDRNAALGQGAAGEIMNPIVFAGIVAAVVFIATPRRGHQRPFGS